jgi:hypothetical protein
MSNVAASATVSARLLLEADVPAASVTENTSEELAVAVGVPLMAQPERDKPLGRLPDATAQV